MVQRFFFGIVFVLSCAGLSFVEAAPLPEQIFLNLGIKGGAMAPAYKDQIVVQQISYGVTQGGEWEEGNRLSGRITNFSNLTIQKLVDFSSPSLATACAMKAQFPKVELTFAPNGRDPFLKLTLEKVIITLVSVEVTEGERPKESVALSFRKATWEVGTARGGYDLEKNQKN